MKKKFLLLVSFVFLFLFKLSGNTLLFEENRGQVTGDEAYKVTFMTRTAGITIFLLNDGISYQFNRISIPNNSIMNTVVTPFPTNENTIETYRIDMRLMNCNPASIITKEGKSSDYINYYNYNILNVFSYQKVTYHDIYPNIDWVIYFQEGNIKYDFIVHPGGDLSQICMKPLWAEDVFVTGEGDLMLTSYMGKIIEKHPISFQEGKEIETRFYEEADVIKFIVNDYDSSQMLTIDPSVVWSTYYGDAGDDWGIYCETDKFGDVFMLGYTSSWWNIALGGFQNTYGGGIDAYLVKFDANGNRLWATYYGGGAVDEAGGLAIDNNNNIYIAGRTNSNANISFNGHQNIFGGVADAFLVKFNTNGVRLWGTYYGGTDEDLAYGCATDTLGNVYLSGHTRSTSSIAHNGHQNVKAGAYLFDNYIVKFDSNGVRLWGTYYGGIGEEHYGTCATDYFGNVYLYGEMEAVPPSYTSLNLAFNGYQNTYGGGMNDVYLVKFNSSGVRQWATYYGGTGIEKTDNNSCTTDHLGNVYISGITTSLSGIAVNGFQNTFQGGTDAFLVKFDSNGIRLWGTYYGGTGNESASCKSGYNKNVYLTGRTQSLTNIAYNGLQNSYGGGVYDAFLAKFSSSGSLIWSSYYGGSNEDYGHDLVEDNLNNVYLAGSTKSTFGISYNGFQNGYAGGNFDAYLVKINDPIILPIAITLKAYLIDNYAFLEWENYGNETVMSYSVEMSKDNTVFNPIYETQYFLGSHHYNYIDESSFVDNDVVFYRVKITDLDGSIYYSNVEAVNHSDKTDFFQIRLFPNPLENELNIKFIASYEEQARFYLYSLEGKVVFQWSEYIHKGIHNIEKDISALPSGTYFLKAYFGGKNSSERIIKR